MSSREVPFAKLDVTKTETTQCSVTSNNLGTLKILPPELRLMIWKELSPSANSKRGHLGILGACRQLNDEISPYIYDSQVLTIHIKQIWSKWFTVENNKGGIWEVPNTHCPIAEAFSNLPWGKLLKICIVIDAPKNADPTEHIVLARHTRDLATLLEKAEKLPVIEFCLLDTPDGMWAKPDGSPRQGDCANVLLRAFWDPLYAGALLPFCRIRDIPDITIHLPQNFIRNDEATDILEKYQTAMQDQKPFGSNLEDDHWNDNLIQEEIDDVFLHTESVLDTVPGEVADMMRLERYQHWYTNDGESFYNSELKRMGATDELLNGGDDKFCGVEERHEFLVAFNPLSANMQRMRLKLGVSQEYRVMAGNLQYQWDIDHWRRYYSLCEATSREIISSEDEEAVSRLKSTWSQDEWESYFPRGIPPINLNHKDIMDFSIEMEEGCTWKNRYVLGRIQEQVKSIDFGRGEKTRLALSNFFNEDYRLFNPCVPMPVSCEVVDIMNEVGL